VIQIGLGINAPFEILALYLEDADKPVRKSHENPYITKLYEEFLGAPMSEKSHHHLHTIYFDRSKN
jgi:NADP-reducing hydrogenase subunit HndD